MTQQTFKPSHTSIAIHAEGLPGKLIPCTAARELHLESEDGKRLVHLAQGERFYLAASESAPGYFYILKEFKDRYVWRCTCPSTKPCKHEKALRELLLTQYQAKRAEEEQAPIQYSIRENMRAGTFYPIYKLRGEDWQSFRDGHGKEVSFLWSSEAEDYIKAKKREAYSEEFGIYA